MKSHALVLKENCSLSNVVPENIHSRVNPKNSLTSLPWLHLQDEYPVRFTKKDPAISATLRQLFIEQDRLRPIPKMKNLNAKWRITDDCSLKMLTLSSCQFTAQISAYTHTAGMTSRFLYQVLSISFVFALQR